MSQEKKIRFAVLIDGETLKNWQVECIKSLLADQHNHFVGFILNNQANEYNSSRLSLGFRWLERQCRKKHLFQSSSIQDVFQSKPIIQVNTYKKGIYQHIEEESFEKLEALNCDFFLRFGFGIIGGKLLNIPKAGVWSFHHGDPEEFRGGPPSFWEFIKSQKSNGFVLQKLSTELDGGEILCKGRIALWKHSYFDHLERLFAISIPLVKQASRKLYHQGAAMSTSKPQKKGQLYKAPGNFAVIQLYLKVFKSKIHFHYIQLFKGEIWNIGVAKQLKIQNGKTIPSEISWMPLKAKNLYQADPFFGEDDRIYFEEYDYAQLKANISAIVFSQNKWQKQSVFMDRDFHLSFPYFFQNEGKHYLLPEQHQSNEVSLYELNEKFEIHHQHQLIKGKWVDPCIFKHKGYWWLCVSPQEFSNECLHLFYAEQLKGPYKEHLLNPVKIDIQSARNGGLPFQEDDQWIRPSQNSENGYGSSIKLNHIKTLSPTAFEEECISEIFPNPESQFNQALHTFSKKDGAYLIDGKYTTFVFSSFKSQLKRKMKRLLKND